MSSQSHNSGPLKLVVSVLVLIIIGLGIWVVAPPTGYNNGYAPEQPIPFSHKLHAGAMKIPCLYCHVNADKSKHSTVPALNVCMNCHGVVRKAFGSETESPHIKKLVEAYQAGTPVQWVRVHMLPDFVFFNHKRHIARGVQCQTCHGEVQEMERVGQYSDLSMGWCVNCHRKPENNAPIQCDTCHN